MPGERLSMRKIRELLRLRWEQQLPQRVIANSLRLGQASVSDYLSRARRAGLTWPLPDGLDDAQLEALLFPPLPDVPSDQRPVPDWSAVHRDLRRPNVQGAGTRHPFLQFGRCDPEEQARKQDGSPKGD